MSKNSTDRAPDPRPARTRAVLSDALFELIQEKRWERITVQDILERSECGRSTFYAHYENKFDLLTSGIPSITLPIASTDALMPDLLPLFEHVNDMLPVLRPLLSQPLLGEVNDAFRRQLADAWRQHLLAQNIQAARTEIAACFLAGAFMAVCTQWVETGCQQATQQICDQFTELAAATVRAATNPT